MVLKVKPTASVAVMNISTAAVSSTKLPAIGTSNRPRAAAKTISTCR